jgi:hypothetical protein
VPETENVKVEERLHEVIDAAGFKESMLKMHLYPLPNDRVQASRRTLALNELLEHSKIFQQVFCILVAARI